jgi:hypothetical protein
LDAEASADDPAGVASAPRTVRIGSGAGFADDRIEPAADLAHDGRLDYLVFECLAERTIALAQQERLARPDLGYNAWLTERMRAVLEPCVREGTRIITNMGAANPLGAAEVVAAVAADLGLSGITVAAVVGDDVLALVRDSDRPLLDRPGTVRALGDSIVSANAYLGCEAVIEALVAGADVVITGRVADPSLYLAPLVHEFGWALDDWDRLGRGVGVGHLLECGAQVTGGYFADPGKKEVPDLGRLGFPIAEVTADGSLTITKLPGSGGRVTVATCTEQLLYEVHDPSSYVSADVVADFSQATLTTVGPDSVAVTGITGRHRPDELKVSIGYLDGYIGEGQISYWGPNAPARAGLAIDIVAERLARAGFTDETQFDTIGGGDCAAPHDEVRVRVVGRTESLHGARRLGREVTALWLNGPAGGGGATRTATEVVAIASVLVPREQVPTTVVTRIA